MFVLEAESRQVKPKLEDRKPDVGCLKGLGFTACQLSKKHGGNSKHSSVKKNTQRSEWPNKCTTSQISWEEKTWQKRHKVQQSALCAAFNKNLFNSSKIHVRVWRLKVMLERLWWSSGGDRTGGSFSSKPEVTGVLFWFMTITWSSFLC